MSNCAIYIKDSNKIEQFITDACQTNINNNVINIEGSNGKRIGIKLSLFDFKWTNDIANPIFIPDENNDGKPLFIGYDKKVSDLAEDGENTSASIPNASEYRKAVKITEIISSKTDDQIRTYVSDRVRDLAAAKVYLIDLSIIVAALYKIVNKRINKG